MRIYFPPYQPVWYTLYLIRKESRAPSIDAESYLNSLPSIYLLNCPAGDKKPVYRPHLRKPLFLTCFPVSQHPNTAKLSSLLLPRTLTFAANTNLSPRSTPSLDQTMNDGKKGRRRRSSSLIIYQEPLESPEHMSDQSALPNLNATWVNAKGTMKLPNPIRPALVVPSAMCLPELYGSMPWVYDGFPPGQIRALSGGSRGLICSGKLDCSDDEFC